ncbi:DUF2333 family protein [Celerinatantimonas sp. YJH-8]|uniref:DUF2333 family protein n=1 Tax=Celerinatantimonas sp. YJH-8 TaxID=3228714 RepID=UPI0038C5C7C8
MTWSWSKRNKLILGAILIIVILFYGISVYWSQEPDPFDVERYSKQVSTQINEPIVPGFVTTTTLIHMMQVLLDKPGGYLSNDVMPPSVFMDNMPAWELGALTQIRDMSLIMRKDFSRSQSQSEEDADLKIAQPKFYIDHQSWIFPSAESEYGKGIKLLESYRHRLSLTGAKQAYFYARADNLVDWLREVQNRLGSLSQQLSASVGRARLNTSLSDTPDSPSVENSQEKTSWFQLDDVFYRSRGASWALLELMKAVDIDFRDVLQNKNAVVSMRQIIRELEATQQPMWSPMVLNGSGFGVLANHSLVMANYISRCNAAVIDLIELLNNG